MVHTCPQVDQDTVVLTGGRDNPALVTEYSGLASGQVTSKRLPGLVTGRWTHACGSYTDGAGQRVGLSPPGPLVTLTQVLIVTGGHQSPWNLDSTELLSYPDGQAWTYGGNLVSRQNRLKGASLAGVFHVMGGWADDTKTYHRRVFAWDPVAKTWSKVGSMVGEARKSHAIATIPDYCP